MRIEDQGLRIEDLGVTLSGSSFLSPQSLQPLKPKISSKIENILTSRWSAGHNLCKHAGAQMANSAFCGDSDPVL